MCNIDLKKEQPQCCYCKLIAGVCFAISMILIVGGFLMPPTGEIDGSVLTAVGELVLFPVITYSFRAIEMGMEIKIQRGETSVEISKDDD